MKKTLALILAAAMLFALLTACGSGGKPAGTAPPEQTAAAPTAGPPTASDTETAAPTEGPEEEESLYNYAAGKYEVGADGYPTSTYEYELPLTTSDEVLTFWTVVFMPQFIPEDGYEELPNIAETKKMTGVNVEYIVLGPEVRGENMAIMLAADELPDMMSQALYYTGMGYKQNIEDGYLLNLYDYREYMPNYMYYANSMGDDNVKTTVMPEEGWMYAVYAMYDESLVTMGYLAREDWLEKLGMTNTDINTLDDVHEMLTLFKTQIDGCRWPMEMISSVDVVCFFSCFDTITQVNGTGLPTGYIVDGKVVMPHSGENDYNYASTLAQWNKEGLIDPGWTGYYMAMSFENYVSAGTTGFVFMQPMNVITHETAAPDPDTRWEPVHNPYLREGQTLHFAYQDTYLNYGHTCLSAKCSNIELALTWCDWRYSTQGSFFSSYGVQGLTWDYNDAGEPELTEFSLNNENGIDFGNLCNIYMANFLAEHGMEIYQRKYAFKGGERFRGMHDVWADVNTDKAYQWPSAVTFTADQESELAGYSGDIVTFIAENFLAFLSGNKPMTEWNAYVGTLNSLGWDEVRRIKQEAYDAFIAANG